MQFTGSWYRNEALPNMFAGDPSSGPPYGLLQGKMDGINFPQDETNHIQVKNGTVCAIPHSDAFLINIMDHIEWSGSFTVLGYVDLNDSESWNAIREIMTYNYSIFVHPQYQTHMRMLEHELHFSIMTEDEYRDNSI